MVAIFLAMPMFLWRTLNHHIIDLPGLEAIDFCYEDWPVTNGRAFYSVFVMLVQFFVPMLTVTISYCKIVQKLKNRMPKTSVLNKTNAHREDIRNKKTNVLLMAIALIFCLSWLPFHVFNIIVDIDNPFGDDIERTMEVYTFCHMLGMSSACSNPVLYGWLNENFRKEFCEIYALFISCKACTGRRIKIGSTPTLGNCAFIEKFLSRNTGNDIQNRESIEQSPIVPRNEKLNQLRTQNSRKEDFIVEEVIIKEYQSCMRESLYSNKLRFHSLPHINTVEIFKISSETL